MHVVCFDIDGTLVDSAGFDSDLYVDSIQHVLGVAIDTDWSQYENVTDSGILEKVLAVHSAPEQRANLARDIESTFCERTARYLAENSAAIREVPGAVALVESLCKSPRVRVCVATGGWRATAILKLRAIGLEPKNLPMATSSDAVRRTDIMLMAESRAAKGMTVRKRTYFGDGIWDKKAAAELGYDFVAVGDDVAHHVAFSDLQNRDEILAELGI